jgi:uncharacterized protein (TIGR02246 family)
MRKISIILLILVAGCTTKKVDKKAEGEKVKQVSREWSRVASAGDLEKTLSYWDDSAYMIFGNEPALRGKEAIRRMVEESFKTPGFKISWEPESVEVSDNGDMAYLIENSKISFTDSSGKTVTENNKGVTIWRKQKDGNWKNVVDMSTPAGN